MNLLAYIQTERAAASYSSGLTKILEKMLLLRIIAFISTIHLDFSGINILLRLPHPANREIKFRFLYLSAESILDLCTEMSYTSFKIIF